MSESVQGQQQQLQHQQQAQVVLPMEEGGAAVGGAAVAGAPNQDWAPGWAPS